MRSSEPMLASTETGWPARCCRVFLEFLLKEGGPLPRGEVDAEAVVDPSFVAG
jgi:hypothetical protein